MTRAQKTIKYLALALAAFLIFCMISTIFSLATFFFGGKPLSEELSRVEIEKEYNALNIELFATSLEIRVGETFLLETNDPSLEIKVKDRTLCITEDEGWGRRQKEDALLVLTVPAEFLFRMVEMTVGAGNVWIEDLRVEHLDLELGAGSVKIDMLRAESSAEIEGGAGELKINGALKDLDLDMGVGALELRAELIGKASIDCGIGEVQITLLGGMENYTVKASKGIGEVTLNGEDLPGGTAVGNGNTSVSVSGGVGTVRILTEEASS